MADKKSFVLYKDQKDVFNSLTDEEAGQLIKALFNYEDNNELPKFKGLFLSVFLQFKQTLDRDRDKWLKRAEAGSKGGKQKVANRSKSKQSVASVSVNVSDNVSNIPSLDDVIKYSKEFSGTKNQIAYVQAAKEAHAYYENIRNDLNLKRWTDSNGKPIKNWKLKLRSVWFSKVKDIPETRKGGMVF